MTKCYLDSNVLIYLKDERSFGYQRSRKTIEKLVVQNISLYVSPLCLDEFLHGFGKALRSKTPEKEFFTNLERALVSIFKFPQLFIINPPTNLETHAQIISLMETYSLRPRDAYHLLTMQENKINGFATCDKDFEKVFASKILERA
ncbi:type II toxin-antitoxin system VapC family toxin [Candidatus Gottesmanbacteria bacterium]|nr:type II toxin-antitoxin system VapC family toxin [Candidatus Gottesmanbacteria bacterium]